MNILVINCGSSSVKASLYALKNDPHAPIPSLKDAHLHWKGHFEEMVLETKIAGKKNAQPISSRSFPTGLKQLIDALSSDSIDAIGHRIVHGGKHYRESVRINPDVKEKIRQFAQFAPLHNFPALEGIEALEKLFSKTPQIAVFDTAFHHTLPTAATIYPVPYQWFEEGIQRYGFHGISYQYCSKRAAEILQKPPSKMVICHLGAGASLCAVKDMKSCDTTMGFTPLEGLMMNTRSGTIDPGILLEKLKTMSVSELSDQLYRQSGLLGVSGLSSDMRDVLAEAPQHPRAKLAWDLYIHRLCASIGSMIASLEGLDTLVFTAGIGENIPLLRKKVCERLAFLGLQLDHTLNEQTFAQDRDIAIKSSNVRVLVLHTEEAFEIAGECWRLTNSFKK